MSTPEQDPLDVATKKLDELEKKRAALEETDDPEQAVELLTEITELAKQAHANIEEARKQSDATT